MLSQWLKLSRPLQDYGQIIGARMNAASFRRGWLKIRMQEMLSLVPEVYARSGGHEKAKEKEAVCESSTSPSPQKG